MDMQIELTFTEDLLGTVPMSKDVYAKYIADRKGVLNHEEPLTGAELEEELETVVEDLENKGWTTFHRLNDDPILYDYVLKGFFKDACGMLRRVKGTASSKLKAYKKEIDGLVFVAPRRLRLELPAGAEMGINERPLRAQTAQGERVALARSDCCPAGTTLSFTVTCLGGNIDEKTICEWLDYGKLRGLGQWRNAGWGAFTWNEV